MKPMSDERQTVVFLVRHGQTDQPYSSDPKRDGERVLTEEGREQIKRVGAYLKDFAPRAIYASPLKRTFECAEIIRAVGEIDSQIEQRSALVEIYDNQHYLALATEQPEFLAEIVAQHAGQAIVCVSHQDVIEGALRALKVTAAEADLPCGLADVYRLVFAGGTFVECLKLQPAAK